MAGRLASLIRSLAWVAGKGGDSGVAALESAAGLMIVAPHMDDDVLCCGGLLALRAGKGLPPPTVVYLTDGSRGTPGLERDETLNARRKREAREALEELGAGGARQVFLDLPDMGLKLDRASAGLLAAEIERERPGFLLANPPFDSHPDHRAAAEIVLKALTEAGKKGVRPRLFLYEVYSAMPRCGVVDITGTAEAKRRAIRRHASQMLLHPYDEYVLGLNRFRGLQAAQLGEPGVRYAEGFLETGLDGLRDMCAAGD